MRFSSFLGELHRRGVWQVLGSYAVVAWIVLQLAETLEGLIGLPLWFGPAIVVVVLLGFPVFLVTTLTQGGFPTGDREAALGQGGSDGNDWSVSSWKPLEGRPVRDALRHLFTWRNALFGGAIMAVALAVGSAGYSGLRSAGVGPFGSLMAKGVFESNENLLLADFENHTSDGTLAETVTALFRIDLRQSTSLHLLDRTELSQALIRMQRDPTESLTYDVTMELAQREGVKAVVAGEVLPLGPGAVVSARLVAASTGDVLVSLRETARTIDDVPDAVDRLSAQLRERIGESLKSIRGNQPLGEVTTGSIDALRKYVQADWALEMGDVATAEGLVKEAIALDSTFAMAYRKLGVILSNETRNRDEALAAFTKAYEGRTRLTDRERYLAEAAYFTYVAEDIDAAVEAYERVLAIHPGDGIAGNNLAVVYGDREEYGKAADLYLRAIERGHAPAVSYTNATFTLFRMGEADSASAVLARFRGAYPEHPSAFQYSAALASARFDYDGAERYVQRLMEAQEGVPRWEVWGNAELANYALVRGRITEATERLLRAHDLQDQAGTRFFDQPKEVFQAIATATVRLHFLEDPEGAVQVLDQLTEGALLDSVPAPERGYLDLADLYAKAGRPGRAREFLSTYLAQVPEEDRAGKERGAALKAAEASIALAEGDPEEAVRLYLETRTLAPNCLFCGLPDLGVAYEAASKPDSALSTYQEYLSIPGLFRSQNDNVRLHRVLLGLGRSHEALGQPDVAARYFGRVVDLWADADPALEPRIRRLRARVEALNETAP